MLISMLCGFTEMLFVAVRITVWILFARVFALRQFLAGDSYGYVSIPCYMELAAEANHGYAPNPH